MKPLAMALFGLCGCSVAHAQSRDAAVARVATTTLPSVEARQASLGGGLLVTLSVSGDLLVAYDPITYAERWRRRLSVTNGAESHFFSMSPSTVAVHSGTAWITVDRATGVVRSTVTTLMRSGRVYVWRSGESCALNGACRYSPISCEDGRALGPVIVGEDQGPHFHDSEPSELCSGFDHIPIGAARGVALHAVRGQVGAAPTTVIALRVADGSRAYATPIAELGDPDTVMSGVLPDGSVAWVAGVVGNERVVVGFDVASGAIRWRRSIASRTVDPVAVATHDRSVDFLFRGSAISLDTARGTRRWATTLMPDEVGAIAGATVQQFSSAYGGTPRALRAIDARTGRALARTAFTSEEGLVLENGSLRAAVGGARYDENGEAYATTAWPTSVEVVRNGWQPALVRRRSDRTTLATLATDGWLIGEVRAPDGVIYALVIERDREGVGRVLRIRL